MILLQIINSTKGEYYYSRYTPTLIAPDITITKEPFVSEEFLTQKNYKKLMSDNELTTYRHGESTFQGRVMQKDQIWTTVMVYKDGKPDKPLTVKTHTLEKVSNFEQRNAN